MSEPLAVTIDVTLEDYEALVVHFLKDQSTVRRLRQIAALIAILVAAAAVVPAVVNGQRVGSIHLAFVGAALAILWIGSRSATIMRRTTVQQFANSEDVSEHLGSQQLIFEPHGLSSHARTASHWYAWELVSKVLETDTHLFIHVGAYRAFILPRASFASPLSWDELVAAIRTHRSQARNYFPRCPHCGFDLSHAPVSGCPECGWQRFERSDDAGAGDASEAP